MNDDDRTLTRADKQDILDHITRERRNGDNYVDEQLSEVKEDMKQLKEDVNTIASVFGFSRDRQTGQLKRR